MNAIRIYSIMMEHQRQQTVTVLYYVVFVKIVHRADITVYYPVK